MPRITKLVFKNRCHFRYTRQISNMKISCLKGGAVKQSTGGVWFGGEVLTCARAQHRADVYINITIIGILIIDIKDTGSPCTATFVIPKPIPDTTPMTINIESFHGSCANTTLMRRFRLNNEMDALLLRCFQTAGVKIAGWGHTQMLFEETSAIFIKYHQFTRASTRVSGTPTEKYLGDRFKKVITERWVPNHRNASESGIMEVHE